MEGAASSKIKKFLESLLELYTLCNKLKIPSQEFAELEIDVSMFYYSYENRVALTSEQ